MAQERYGFFNSSGEDTRSYDASDMATALNALATNGVAGSGACLQVTAEGSTMRTLIGYGSAMLEGYFYQLRDDGGEVQAFEHTTESELNRIDRIILRLDYQERKITMVKLIGTAASTPAAPDLTRDENQYEISLAQVLIQAGAAEIGSTDITDEREDESVCGLIAPQAFPQSVLEQMIGSAITAALDQVDEDYADVLRYSEQVLETTQKTQARTNIGAQQLIGASGLLKGDGSGGVSAAAEGTDYAGVSGGKVLPDRTTALMVARGATHDLQAEYNGKLIKMVNTYNLTITIQPQSTIAYEDEFEVEYVRYGANTVTFAAGTGVTINSVDGMRSISDQYACVSLKRIAENEWLLTGSLA